MGCASVDVSTLDLVPAELDTWFCGSVDDVRRLAAAVTVFLADFCLGVFTGDSSGLQGGVVAAEMVCVSERVGSDDEEVGGEDGEDDGNDNEDDDENEGEDSEEGVSELADK
mmetsp:Transcript_13806/g.19677  ORF Transcript_13806/g.19677 Transcript_13806/m.19677 type:complete len:112 (+) Transcript_13806:1516-1851(+)|eukprot:CAMPEP_0175102820 /NCGR_PEP_ID=MMETSP0086_2-20121207/8683_1 /TAXON_ID=136419 /ORGANISM="Unknown Unknown, Strain D1" /LENGTH=111 /DNA_ID=CAMNT_0016377741 /DNA_START=1516 /DNA_END=1851 /DNA_ORIENTATION=-